MDLVIHDLPGRLLEKLDKKAKASGRTVEAEAAAILSETLDVPEIETGPAAEDAMDELQRMVLEAYGGKLPGNVVDEFLAERRKLWGEAD